MKKEKFNILATGEVLGQRPFSQTKSSLEKVRKEGGIEILRPLSAKLLPPTKYEAEDLVSRRRLSDIQGRTRERQFELVKKFKIREFPSPAGGCLLTDPEFSQRLIVMFDNWKKCDIADIELLKYGRVFWLNLEGQSEKVLVVVGRKKSENEMLEKLAKEGDIMLELIEEMGPTTLIRGLGLRNAISGIASMHIPKHLDGEYLVSNEKYSPKELIELTAATTGCYSTKARGKNVKIRIKKFNS